jgi:hypothetical protein
VFEYTGLDGAFFSHYRLRCFEVFLLNQSDEIKVCLISPGLSLTLVGPFLFQFNRLGFLDGH